MNFIITVLTLAVLCTVSVYPFRWLLKISAKTKKVVTRRDKSPSKICELLSIDCVLHCGSTRRVRRFSMILHPAVPKACHRKLENLDENESDLFTSNKIAAKMKGRLVIKDPMEIAKKKGPAMRPFVLQTLRLRSTRTEDSLRVENVVMT